MINVTNCTHVNVGFFSFKYSFAIDKSPTDSFYNANNTISFLKSDSQHFLELRDNIQIPLKKSRDLWSLNAMLLHMQTFRPAALLL